MAAIKQENQKLLRAMADFEKELVKMNNFLKDNTESFRQSLVSLNEKARNIEEIVNSNPDAKNAFDSEVAEKKLLAYYVQFENSLTALKKALFDVEDQNLKTQVFLESSRRERSYLFPSDEVAVNFLTQAFSLYSINTVFFRPQFVGVLDLEELAKQLDLKKARQQLLVEVSRFPELISFLRQKNSARNFLLESAEMRIFMKTILQARVEADNPKIKRLDRLAKELGAKLE